MSVLQHPRAGLATELARVRDCFDAELRSSRPFVSSLAHYLERYRGKMLRPTLLLLAGQATGQLTDAHYTLAAVVEMVHMATLVHDDVLDESHLRRRQPTIHALHGNEAAVLLGDYLFSHAFHLCSSLNSQDASRQIAATAHRLCEGELLQVAARGRWDLGVDEYYEIITGKTAELVAVSARLGAQWAGADEDTVANLAEYGLQCGLAFQIVDDVLDLTGTETKLGKDTGRDVGMGKLTLPLILYLGSASAADRAALVSLLEAGPERIADVRALVQRSDALEQAVDAARQHVRTAVHSLADLPLSPACETLVEMAEFIVQRQA